MAKKARQKAKEDAEEAFEFPEFELKKFLTHEYEQTFATAIVVMLAVALAVLAFLLDRTGLPVVLPVILGIAVVAFSPFVVQRLRPAARDYTKGDWAGLMLTETFGWLGLWFLLLNVLHV
jgi:hypothetical protein